MNEPTGVVKSTIPNLHAPGRVLATSESNLRTQCSGEQFFLLSFSFEPFLINSLGLH